MQKLVHTPKGLFLHYGKATHKVRQVLQGVDFLSVEYFVTGHIDPETQKPVRRTLIMEIEKDGTI